MIGYARVYGLVEAVRKLGYNTFLCLVDLPALSSQTPTKEFREYWGDNFVYFKAGWRWNKSSWSLPLKGLFLVGLQRLLGKFVSSKTPLIRNLFNFQFIDQWTPKQFARWFKEFESQRNVDAIFCEYAFMAGIFDELGSDYTKIIDTQDVFTDRNKKLNYKFNWINLSAQQERTLLNKADRVIAIQEEEAVFFKQSLSVDARVSCIDIITQACVTEAPMPAVPTLGYLASRNPINLEAIDWFIAKIWPLIVNRLPTVKLRIAGGISDHVAKHLTNIEVLGRVEDIAAFYGSCNCIVNPALSGTGLKIKTIEALMYGKPVVSTSEGASGLKPWDGSGYKIVETATQFAETCLQILSDDALARSLSQSARQFINERYQHNMHQLQRIINNQ